MLTSAGLYHAEAYRRKLGIQAYLPKPVRQAELLKAVQLALGSLVAKDRPWIEAHPLRSRAGQLRILLAEDNLVNQKVAIRTLEKRDAAVTVAETGAQALEILERQSFDLILMDVQMPQLNGFDTTAAIRQREESSNRHIPIIAMTAHAMPSDRQRCLDAGMDDYISKPINMKELFDAIERVMPHPVHTPDLDRIAV